MLSWWWHRRPDGSDLLVIQPAAVLLGLAAGWQWLGIEAIIASGIDPLPGTVAMVGAVALLAAAVGPWLPERLVLGVARFVRERGRRGRGRAGDQTGTFWMLRAARDRDPSLMWLAMSLLAAAAGVASLLTAAASPLFTRLYGYLLDNFFWTNLTLSALEWSWVTLLMGVSWVMHGVQAAMLAPAVESGHRSGGRAPGVVSGILAGVGTSWVAHGWWSGRGLSAQQEYMAGVLVMFVLAATAARRSQRPEGMEGRAGGPDMAVPEIAGQGAGLIWLLLVAWGVAWVLVVSGWLECRLLVTDGRWSTWRSAGAYVLVMATGMAGVPARRDRRRRSASGCGMAAWLAGLGAGAAAMLAGYRPTSAVAGAAQLVAAALPFGYALHYAERAWLARAGSRTLGFAQLTSAVLAGSGAGLIVVQWWVMPMLGAVGAMTAGALLMLASGGLVQVYEEDRPVRIRQMRLGLVFATLGAAIVVFPSNARHWARWVREQATEAPGLVGLDWLAEEELPAARRICLIGVDSSGASHWEALGKARVDIMPLDVPGRASGRAHPAGGRTRVFQMSAMRGLRLERGVYDLVYQCGVGQDGRRRYATWSKEWLACLAKHTMAGGEVIVDVPLAGLSPEAVAVVAATFEQAMGGPAVWKVVDSVAGGGLRLMGRSGAMGPVVPKEQGVWAPVERLVADFPGVRAHSLRRDRITPALASGQADTRPIEEWLKHCQQATQPGQFSATSSGEQ